MSVYVIGDIHGAYLALKQVLERTPLTKQDTLIFLGDYVDGWSQPIEVLDLLITLNTSHHCIFLKGNHDQLLLDWLTQQTENTLWLNHGGAITVQAYQKASTSTIEAHIHFLSNLKNYHLDDQNNLFVHAGFTSLKGVNHEHFPQLLYWDRTLWEMTLGLDTRLNIQSSHYPKRLKCYNTIYIGHTPTTHTHSHTPVNLANLWNLDTGAGFKGKLSIMNIQTKALWQSDFVYKLYPNELGRN